MLYKIHSLILDVSYYVFDIGKVLHREMHFYVPSVCS